MRRLSKAPEASNWSNAYFNKEEICVGIAAADSELALVLLCGNSG